MYEPRTLESAVRATGPLLMPYLSGFDDENRISQAPGLPNHISWTLGHLSLAMHRAADLVAGFNEPQQLPTCDWVHGDGTAGDPSRFDTESVKYGSTPTRDSSSYPRMKRSIEIFESSIDRLAGEVGSSSESSLQREVKWGSSVLDVGSLVHRIIFHNGMHAGQIADLRRALGMGSVLG